MKVLLDECVDQRFRNYVLGHDVYTAGYLGWVSVKNGELLRRAAADGFDCLITVDRGMSYQHNPATLALAVICIETGSDELDELIAAVPSLLEALATLTPNRFVSIR